LRPETTRFQYLHGVAEPELVAPESYALDQAMLERKGNDEIQLDLFLDFLKIFLPTSPSPCEFLKNLRAQIWQSTDRVPRGSPE
jgi:hypothetical protein